MYVSPIHTAGQREVVLGISHVARLGTLGTAILTNLAVGTFA